MLGNGSCGKTRRRNITVRVRIREPGLCASPGGVPRRPIPLAGSRSPRSAPAFSGYAAEGVSRDHHRALRVAGMTDRWGPGHDSAVAEFGVTLPVTDSVPHEYVRRIWADVFTRQVARSEARRSDWVGIDRMMAPNGRRSNLTDAQVVDRLVFGSLHLGAVSCGCRSWAGRDGIGRRRSVIAPVDVIRKRCRS